MKSFYSRIDNYQIHSFVDKLKSSIGRDNPLCGVDVISVDQFDRDRLGYLFEITRQMRFSVLRGNTPPTLAGKVLSCIFYEPSTRTSSSFIAAMVRLGGGVIPITSGVQFSSVVKGESLPDTIRILERYSDVIVLRHPEAGSAKIAADCAKIPVINAGDGIGEHPTQGLLDLFTLLEEPRDLTGCHVVMVGDLKYGRTVHSLVKLLCLYKVRMSFVSPLNLRLPRRLKDKVEKEGLLEEESEDLESLFPKADVVYVTRVQKERFDDSREYEAVKDSYVIDNKLMGTAKEDMLLMHPLPRVGEISEEVDADCRAVYFRQAENGMYVRMALLAAVLGRV